MFTLEQIEEAHAKVKSGADFPAYAKEIYDLGVTKYDCFVTNGHTELYGANNYKISTPNRYKNLTIANTPNQVQFRADLIAHQQGKTDYLTFCNDCAKSGIEKWTVSLDKMTCTYYDKTGNPVYEEQIHQ